MNYKTIFSLLFIIVNISAIVWIQKQTISDNTQNLDSSYYKRENQGRKTYLELIRQTPLFGFDNLVAGWLFLDFIQYYGDTEARDVTGHDLAPDYFQIITEKDPRFIESYIFLESATTLFALRPDRSNEIITNALKKVSADIPYSPQLWITKALNQILFLEDIEGAAESYRQALAWAKLQPEIYSDKDITRLQDTVTFLESKPDSRLVSASSWAGLLNRARDEKTREKILEYLDRIGAEVTITPYSVSVRLKDS